jgi:hypothetical protein
MRRAWDPQQPVESLFKQIQDCTNYSEAGGVLIDHPQQINVRYAKNICNGPLHERMSPVERETGIVHKCHVFHFFSVDGVDDGVCLVLLRPMVVYEGDEHVGGVHSAEVVLGQVAGRESLWSTLGGKGALAMSFVWIVVCDLVCSDMDMGEAKIGFDDSVRHGRWVNFGGAAASVGDGVCCTLSLKMAANSAGAKMVLSPTRVNGSSGWGFCKASVMSLAAMINLSVDDNCGIW